MQIWDGIFAQSGEFFNLPPEKKTSIAMMNSRHFRGYAAFGVEMTAGRRDLREQIDFGWGFLPRATV